MSQPHKKAKRARANNLSGFANPCDIQYEYIKLPKPKRPVGPRSSAASPSELWEARLLATAYANDVEFQDDRLSWVFNPDTADLCEGAFKTFTQVDDDVESSVIIERHVASGAPIPVRRGRPVLSMNGSEPWMPNSSAPQLGRCSDRQSSNFEKSDHSDSKAQGRPRSVGGIEGSTSRPRKKARTSTPSGDVDGTNGNRHVDDPNRNDGEQTAAVTRQRRVTWEDPSSPSLGLEMSEVQRNPGSKTPSRRNMEAGLVGSGKHVAFSDVLASPSASLRSPSSRAAVEAMVEVAEAASSSALLNDFPDTMPLEVLSMSLHRPSSTPAASDAASPNAPPPITAAAAAAVASLSAEDLEESLVWVARALWPAAAGVASDSPTPWSWTCRAVIGVRKDRDDIAGRHTAGTVRPSDLKIAPKRCEFRNGPGTVLCGGCGDPRWHGPGGELCARVGSELSEHLFRKGFGTTHRSLFLRASDQDSRSRSGSDGVRARGEGEGFSSTAAAAATATATATATAEALAATAGVSSMDIFLSIARDSSRCRRHRRSRRPHRSLADVRENNEGNEEGVGAEKEMAEQEEEGLKKKSSCGGGEEVYDGPPVTLDDVKREATAQLKQHAALRTLLPYLLLVQRHSAQDFCRAPPGPFRVGSVSSNTGGRNGDNHCAPASKGKTRQPDDVQRLNGVMNDRVSGDDPRRSSSAAIAALTPSTQTQTPMPVRFSSSDLSGASQKEAPSVDPVVVAPGAGTAGSGSSWIQMSTGDPILDGGIRGAPVAKYAPLPNGQKPKPKREEEEEGEEGGRFWSLAFLDLKRSLRESYESRARRRTLLASIRSGDASQVSDAFESGSGSGARAINIPPLTTNGAGVVSPVYATGSGLTAPGMATDGDLTAASLDPMGSNMMDDRDGSNDLRTAGGAPPGRFLSAMAAAARTLSDARLSEAAQKAAGVQADARIVDRAAHLAMEIVRQLHWPPAIWEQFETRLMSETPHASTLHRRRRRYEMLKGKQQQQAQQDDEYEHRSQRGRGRQRQRQRCASDGGDDRRNTAHKDTSERPINQRTNRSTDSDGSNDDCADVSGAVVVTNRAGGRNNNHLVGNGHSAPAPGDRSAIQDPDAMDLDLDLDLRGTTRTRSRRGRSGAESLTSAAVEIGRFRHALRALAYGKATDGDVDGAMSREGGFLSSAPFVASSRRMDKKEGEGEGEGEEEEEEKGEWNEERIRECGAVRESEVVLLHRFLQFGFNQVKLRRFLDALDEFHPLVAMYVRRGLLGWGGPASLCPSPILTHGLFTDLPIQRQIQNPMGVSYLVTARERWTRLQRQATALVLANTTQQPALGSSGVFLEQQEQQQQQNENENRSSFTRNSIPSPGQSKSQLQSQLQLQSQSQSMVVTTQQASHVLGPHAWRAGGSSEALALIQQEQGDWIQNLPLLSIQIHINEPVEMLGAKGPGGEREGEGEAGVVLTSSTSSIFSTTAMTALIPIFITASSEEAKEKKPSVMARKSTESSASQRPPSLNSPPLPPTLSPSPPPSSASSVSEFRSSRCNMDTVCPDSHWVAHGSIMETGGALLVPPRHPSPFLAAAISDIAKAVDAASSSSSSSSSYHSLSDSMDVDGVDFPTLAASSSGHHHLHHGRRPTSPSSSSLSSSFSSTTKTTITPPSATATAIGATRHLALRRNLPLATQEAVHLAASEIRNSWNRVWRDTAKLRRPLGRPSSQSPVPTSSPTSSPPSSSAPPPAPRDIGPAGGDGGATVRRKDGEGDGDGAEASLRRLLALRYRKNDVGTTRPATFSYRSSSTPHRHDYSSSSSTSFSTPSVTPSRLTGRPPSREDVVAARGVQGGEAVEEEEERAGVRGEGPGGESQGGEGPRLIRLPDFGTTARAARVTLPWEALNAQKRRNTDGSSSCPPSTASASVERRWGHDDSSGGHRRSTEEGDGHGDNRQEDGGNNGLTKKLGPWTVCLPRATLSASTNAIGTAGTTGTAERRRRSTEEVTTTLTVTAAADAAVVVAENDVDRTGGNDDDNDGGGVLVPRSDCDNAPVEASHVLYDRLVRENPYGLPPSVFLAYQVALASGVQPAVVERASRRFRAIMDEQQRGPTATWANSDGGQQL